MVVALDVFLNTQLFCLYWQDNQTEKPTWKAYWISLISQLNMNIISQAYFRSEINLLLVIYYKINLCLNLISI